MESLCEIQNVSLIVFERVKKNFKEEFFGESKVKDDIGALLVKKRLEI